MVMEPGSDIEDRLRSLLVRALDGDATGAELNELNDLLLESPALCKCAARFICDDSYLAGAIKSIDQTAKFLKELRPEAANGVAFEQASGGVAVQHILTHPAPTSPDSSAVEFGARTFVLSATQIINRHGLLVAATAAALMLALAWQYVAMKSEFERLHSIAARPVQRDRDDSRSGSRSGATDISASIVARVTGLVNCDWPDGATPLKFGDPLAPGQRLKLEQGLMQVTFGTGAKVVLEGPTDFTVTTPG